MSIAQVFDVSGSAMAAQMVRMNTTASNLANANSVAATPEQTYRAKSPIFASQVEQHSFGMRQAVGLSENPASSEVQVLGISESQEDLAYRYEPEHPYADESGMVAYPNVSVVTEMANMISASRSFQLNVEVMNTAKTLAERVLSLGQ